LNGKLTLLSFKNDVRDVGMCLKLNTMFGNEMTHSIEKIIEIGGNFNAFAFSHK